MLRRFRQLSWTKRWIVVGIGLSIPTFWLLSLILLHDPELSTAIDIYNCLEPGMPEVKVDEIFVLKRQYIKRPYKDQSVIQCDIGKRYIVVVKSDNGVMSGKWLGDRFAESGTKQGSWVKIRKLVGLPVGNVIRSWTKQ